MLEILEYKRKQDMPIYQPDREEIVIDKIVSSLKDTKFSTEIEALYRKIIEISRKLQYAKILSGNLVLIGFMGTGKSTVGHAISQCLSLEHIDMDQQIEKRAGVSIPEIFSQHGEPYFRQLERTLVQELMTCKNIIVSCGGGVVLDQENVKDLKKMGRVVLLQASAQTIYDRIHEDLNRPLLKNRMDIEHINKLLTQRKEAYLNVAEIIIDTDGKSVDTIAKEIIKIL